MDTLLTEILDEIQFEMGFDSNLYKSVKEKIDLYKSTNKD